MPADSPEKGEGAAIEAPKAGAGEAFDVVLVRGQTPDGQGARVLRARPEHIELGELRPLREGLPMSPTGEVVSLAARPGMPHAYDVKASYTLPAAESSRTAGGPAQVATPEYRDSWERTFAAKRSRALN